MSKNANSEVGYHAKCVNKLASNNASIKPFDNFAKVGWKIQVEEVESEESEEEIKLEEMC